MVYKKQANKAGNYIDKEGVRFDVLSCERTESKEWVQTGTVLQDVDGETVEMPVMEQRLFINKGWDSFEDVAAAVAAYGLTYDPLPEEEVNLTID